MIKLFKFLAKVSHIWSLWNLRSFILVSFSLQCILIIGSSLRIQTSRIWVHRLIWLVYLLADWAAYYAIGLVVPINRLQGQLDTYDIHSFWAPFLLLHIGGPNTIAGFSLEDNELWDRSVLHILVQAGATVISIYRSLSKKRLLAPTLLVLVSALTRYAGRILALYKGSMDVLRAEIVASKARNKKPLVKANDFIAISIPTTIKNVKLVDLAAHSYDLFQKYKGIFCGLSIKTDLEVLDDREKLFSRKPYQAFTEMEMELSLAYDIFYTKIWTIVENKTGKILHWVSLASEVGALILWALANKDGYHKVDIKLTNALLIGGFLLDVVSMVKLFFSDLVICRLIKRKSVSRVVSWAMNKVLLVRKRATKFVLFRRWSGSIKQFNLMQYKERRCCGSRHFGVWIEKIGGLESSVKTVELTDDMKNRIFMNIRARGLYSGSREGITERKTSIVIGEYVLDMYYENEPIANAIQHVCKRLGVVNALIIWHTATHLYCSKNTEESEFRQCNEQVSKYIMYLLFYRPKMILEGAQLGVTVEDMTQRLEKIMEEVGNKDHSQDPSSSTSVGKGALNMERRRMEEKRELVKQKEEIEGIIKEGESGDGEVSMEVISKLASYIKEKLVQVGHSEEIMNEIWIDFLLYAAIRCRAWLHVKQLGNGGEFLTLIWLMMAHLGLTVDVPRNH